MAKITAKFDTVNGKIVIPKVSIVPLKVIIEVNEDATLKHSVFQYQMKMGTDKLPKYYTIGLNAVLTENQIDNLLKKCLKAVKQAEGVKDVA